MMSSYNHYYNAHQQHPTPVNALPVAHTHHAGRSRRAPRPPTAQNAAQKTFRPTVRTMKDMASDAHVSSFRQKFEAGRSFDLDDDMEFCPSLLTEEDLSSINSSSDRSSLSSGSPEASPTQLPQQVAFTLNSQSAAYIPAGFHQQHQQTQVSNNMKLHQPAASRIRNAIPIVNPSTGISMPSPSASPARLQRRWA